MTVAEKDSAVHGMLEEEYRRCRDVLASLQNKLARYPKGALNVRKKAYKGKEYAYHYLVVREAGSVVNRHVSKEELSALQVQLEQRDQCKKEIQTYRRRIAYLEKLLNTPTSKGRMK